MPHTFVVLAYQESEYLEACIRSVTSQTVPSKVVIATSTPNTFIQNIAEKYGLELFCNPEPGKGIGYDFDFARTCTGDPLVTIAHQDDLYAPTYAQTVRNAFRLNPNALILFSDYYEIRGTEKIFSNPNLKIKRLLLTPARLHFLSGTKLVKRAILSMGNSICCPAVTFATENIHLDQVFACGMKCNVDWYAWEQLSREKGQFLYLPQPLMGHRVHEASTTTELIHDNTRTKEDLILFQKFWPKPIAKLLNDLYVKSEESNQTKK